MKIQRPRNELSVVEKEGRRDVIRTLMCYFLESIITVGCRVNSERGTQFRQWTINIKEEATYGP
ncbi:RhuM family protein [Desulfosporosinus sp. PR]|uniref:RhuM family protein n=1 Tax=Candidatus Desulfosporosinus nitrosoreducens TaxID=3401928 RepID=UPI0027F6AAB4|nr:RhuM family protein [Desulfosporosinus sp. PR]MDQ7092175.1 RhuM family protein [Desulfosporosinus sp. PR]